MKDPQKPLLQLSVIPWLPSCVRMYSESTCPPKGVGLLPLTAALFILLQQRHFGGIVQLGETLHVDLASQVEEAVRQPSACPVVPWSSRIWESLV